MRPVSDFISKSLIRIPEDKKVLEAVKIMKENNIGSILVDDSKGKAVGIFTERDFLKKFHFFKTSQMDEVVLGDIMTKDLKTVNFNTPYVDVLKLMREHNIRHMPVIMEGGVIGMVSLRDLVRRYEKNMELLLKEKQIKELESLDQLQRSEENLRTKNQDLETNEKVLRIMIKDKEEMQKKLMDTQQQLVQSEKMATVGTLAAGIAHEIKNPLGIILQGIERVEKNLAGIGDEKNIPFVKMIKKATERATKVVLALLKYSRSSQIDMSVFNVNEMIDDAIDIVNQSATINNVGFAKEYNVQECSVKGDAVMLQQVFVDLFSNAIQAMPDGGGITVIVDVKSIKENNEEEDRVFVDIIDTGTGIEEKRLPKIFDPFYTTKEEGEGTGLGLSTAYLILSQHKGSITVESKPEQGTKFTISLPINKEKSVDKKEG